MSSPSRFSNKVCFGEFELNLETAELRSNCNKAILPGQPFQVLVTLLDHPGRLVTREELKKRLWSSDTFVDFDQSLNKAVNRLREALDDSPERPRFIETLPRKGYRFIGVVDDEPLETDVMPRPEHTTPNVRIVTNQPAAEGVASNRSQGTVTGSPARGYLLAAIITLFLAIAVAFVIFRAASRPGKVDLNSAHIIKLTESGLAQDAAISPDGRYVAYSQRNGEVESLRLREVSTQSDIEVLPSGPGFHGLKFSPDGSHIYLVRSDSKDPFFKYLYSVPALGGAVRKLLTDVDSPVSFSPDGRQFVYEHCLQPKNDVELKIADVDGTGDHLLATLHEASGFLFQPGPSWSPDGQTIVVPALLAGEQHGWILYAISLKDATIRKLYSSPDEIGRPAWLPDSKALMSTLYDRDSRRMQLSIISFPNGEARQITNDLTDYGPDLDVTRNGRVIAATTKAITSNVWTAPAVDPTDAKQITFAKIPTLEVVEAFDGKLLTLAMDGVLWMMVADGAQLAHLAELHNASWLTPCGGFVISLLNEPGMPVLVRVNRDGTGVTKLVAGHLWSPACSADGQFVFYITTDQPQKIWRVPLDTGRPEEIADVMGNQMTGRIAVSPDGTLLAYPFTQYGHVPSDGWRVAIIPATGGAPIQLMPLPGGAGDLHWAPVSGELLRGS